MKNILDQIQAQINERLAFNSKIDKILETTKHPTLPNNVSNYAEYIRDAERSLNHKNINLDIVLRLTSLKNDISTTSEDYFALNVTALIKTHYKNLEELSNHYAQVAENIHSMRSQLRKQGLFDDKIRSDIGYSYTNADASRQMYHQAKYDFDSLIDYLEA